MAPGLCARAISDNRTMGGGNTIAFSNNITGTITLSSGELVINTNVTISGPGQTVLTVSGNNAMRVFHITSGTATISGLTIARGKTNSASAGGILQEAGSLTLSACTVISNSAGILGGAMEGRAQVLASDCTFASNIGTNGGVGGIFQSSGTLSVSNSTFFANNGVFGGALWISNAALQMVNCTLASNIAGFGGGLLLSQGSAAVSNSTIYNNIATHGGGIYDSVQSTLRNTIVASNFVQGLGPDCFGAFTSGGFNLISVTNGSTGWTGTGDLLGNTNIPLNAALGPLQKNGGLHPHDGAIFRQPGSGPRQQQRHHYRSARATPAL